MFLRVWGSFRCFLQILSVFSSVFTERIASGHTSIKHRLVECCSDVCPSVGFSHLHIWSWSSTRVTISFLVTSLTPSPSIAQFGQEASSRKSPGCSKRLPLRVTETICLCEPSILQKFFSELLPRCVAWRNLVSELYRQFFDFRAWFLLWYALSAVGPFIKTCVPFQIIPIQLNLPQFNSTWSVVTSTSNRNAPELNSNCPR